MNMELVEMGASKQEGEEFAGQPCGCVRNSRSHNYNREKWSLQIITLFVQRMETFLRSVLLEKGRKCWWIQTNIHTTLNYYTIVRKTDVLGFECLVEKSWSDRDDRVQGRVKWCANQPKPTSIGSSSSMCVASRRKESEEQHPTLFVHLDKQ